MDSQDQTRLCRRPAGFPPITDPDGKLLVTTAPAPTTTLSPSVTPFRMMARAPMKQPLPMETGRELDEYSVFQAKLPLGTWKSLSKIMQPAPKSVSEPIWMEFPDTMVALLRPTRSPRRIRACLFMVRKTQGFSPPKGLLRRELSRHTVLPNSIVEPSKRLTIGRPQRIGGEAEVTPTKRSSHRQRCPGKRRNRCFQMPMVCLHPIPQTNLPEIEPNEKNRYFIGFSGTPTTGPIPSAPCGALCDMASPTGGGISSRARF